MAKVGDYNMTSDRSGFVYPRSEMRQEWTGRWVHYSEWEPQQPQEIITPKKDNQRVWPVRDEQAVVNVNANAPDNPLTIIGINTNNAQIQNNGFDVVTTANGVLVSAYLNTGSSGRKDNAFSCISSRNQSEASGYSSGISLQ